MNTTFFGLQSMVMEQVLKSNAIVASIFPAEVRDRLFNDGKKGDPRQSKASFNTDFQKAKIKNFLYGDNQNGNNDDNPAEEHGEEANRKNSIIGATGAASDLISSDAIAYEFEVSGSSTSLLNIFLIILLTRDFFVFSKISFDSGNHHSVRRYCWFRSMVRPRVVLYEFCGERISTQWLTFSSILRRLQLFNLQQVIPT